MDNKLISCICLTYNREYKNQLYLLEEAVMSFLKQDYIDKQLVIVNDAPGQILVCNYPGIKIINLEQRCTTLSQKIQIGIDNSDGDNFCRWDDDDIHLPHRLSFSYDKLINSSKKIYWKPGNYIYYPKSKEDYVSIINHGTHPMGIWTRKCLRLIGGYPKGYIIGEDQEFDRLSMTYKLLDNEALKKEEIFYIYRWGVSVCHLSGIGDFNLQWKRIGANPVKQGIIDIVPNWRKDWCEAVKEAWQ